MIEMQIFKLKCAKCPKKFLQGVTVDTNRSKWTPEGTELCNDCQPIYTFCNCCGDQVEKEGLIHITPTFPFHEGDEVCICKKCENQYDKCPICKFYYKHGTGSMVVPEAREYCEHCIAKSKFKKCYCCDDYYLKRDLNEDGYCMKCYQRHSENDICCSQNAPTYYRGVCQKALDVQKKYKLTDVQTLMYNHICRGDFYFRNGDAQSFYDFKQKGFGWDDSKTWVKRKPSAVD